MNPIVALSFMKHSDIFGNAIRDIGYDKFFVHFWSDLQLKMYKQHCSKIKYPTISFDATGGCCKRVKQNNEKFSGSIFLYEGIMEVNDKSFSVFSMLSEMHDNLSISVWLKRWLRCGVPPPKITVSDQSIALMSGLVQAFTQYTSLEKYLNVCYTLFEGNKDVEIPSCFIRNDVNHFIHLITQWTPLKTSKYPRTKQLFTRSMELLIYCKSMNEAKKILEAIFIVALSKYDGPILYSESVNESSERETPCAYSKKFLQSRITSNIIDLFDKDSINDPNIHYVNEDDETTNEESCVTSFKEWAKSIAKSCELSTLGIEGEYDNAQYMPELVPLIINIMKLYPCWSGIMIETFGYGDEI